MGAIGPPEIAAKSLPKAQTAIREAGADNVALVLQGRLTAGDTIAGAGLSAQPGAVRPAARWWWVCRSANAAMWALTQSGVPFRTIVREDGRIERWQQPELPAWEVPKRNPHERRPRAPRWQPETAAQIAELQEVSRLQSEATAAIFYRSIGTAGA